MIVDEKVEVGQIEKIITKKGKKLLESVKLFDIYRDEKLGENKKSVAYSLIFRDKNKTLNDEEINIIYNTIKSKWEELYKTDGTKIINDLKGKINNIALTKIEKIYKDAKEKLL